MTDDSNLALDVLRKFHKETGDVLQILFARHADEATMSKIEKILCELHSDIHRAEDKIIYGDNPNSLRGKD